MKSPGVPPRAPVVAAARERGIPVLGELELGWRLIDRPFVAVTGTNGKTTVTEWLAHTLRLAGRDVVAAGNVGTPLTSLVERPPELVVCECSSYQLADTLAFAPEVGVLLNLGSDHLDWHGSLEHYRASKLRLFARQGPEDVAIAPARIALPGRARRVDLVADWRATLPGGHNAVNAGAVAEACQALGIPDDVVAEGLRTFTGVEHRLELLRERDGVRWVNDSKATNVASTLTALDATPAARAPHPRRRRREGGGLPAAAGPRGARLPHRSGGRAAGRGGRRGALRGPRDGGRAGRRGGRGGGDGAPLAGLRELRPVQRL